ncbi:type I restriction-modification system subunit M [Cesiribacter andamanensis]|uniref:site-specific DNA-methyltransferase (adenine-specific) n=1 Tax=Cesiribacter andamanensis AMV16 TaxID=1279009 RepID=M7N7U8_9BACT|nr:class I SAM-dependent DNA methyltransferase [Cesiribacter andamanensis]EMR04683.1 Type I restriction enzyme EcoKI M protein [Cesiribacter andamanensis AMV16]
MTQHKHPELVGLIWKIADGLRGPYRPPQYRHVMLPMIVLRRMDCVLEEKADEVKAKYESLKQQGFEDEVISRMLGKFAAPDRKQPLYNTSGYTFKRLLADPENIGRNLVAYLHSFSPIATKIFEKFGFEKEIEKLETSNRLYGTVKALANVDLHPETIDNLQMGYVFEDLVRKFNEQANEEAGDHFTPREVIRLMANLVYTADEDIYKPGVVRTVYDPTCGTGGMLSISEEYIREYNKDARLAFFGQEYNEESWAICCSDLLIKDEPVDNIVWGDTLGDGKTGDGHAGKRFHYQLANPPFGVKWETQSKVVEKEHREKGFDGRFGPGTPRSNDGSLLFLLHMISKMQRAPEEGGEGSKIAVVFNGSPLFTGDAGSGESNIRRWIIENDWLDAVVALPDQLFYNTGISTYIWLVTNRKPAERKGKIQLIDATQHFQKMRKSLGNKRNELSEAHIHDITRLYGRFRQNDASDLEEAQLRGKVCSKIFSNREFGYLKMTVERPLRLNFQATPERIARVQETTAFQNLATSKKRKDDKVRQQEIEAGQALQQQILGVLEKLVDKGLYRSRAPFLKAFDAAFKAAGIKLDASLKKAILAALSERDPEAEICRDAKGNPEPDSELRDTELVPLPETIALPLPVDYDSKADNILLLQLVQAHLQAYLEQEVKPHVPDAWIDFKKTKVGYEIPLNRHFYVYEPPRPLELIEEEMKALEGDIISMLREVVQ